MFRHMVLAWLAVIVVLCASIMAKILWDFSVWMMANEDALYSFGLFLSLFIATIASLIGFDYFFDKDRDEYL